MSRKKKAASEKGVTITAKGPALHKGRLKVIGGSQSDDWNNNLASQTLNALWLKHSDEEGRTRQMNGAISGLIGIAPKDELEGMLAVQLVASHSAAMECYRRAMLAEQTFEGRQAALSQAGKLSRTHVLLLEALNRHRGKGQQKVTVEHVHVHAGGQAIVGNVGTPRGGVQSNSEDQPAAKQIAHAPEPEVRSPGETEREPLPVSCDEERPLPNARREVAGTA
ncbi:MAG: hypothetical protein JOZ84_03785 [Methylobacteriaceae bacterium]|nr:hypothetical protein [Methylobacteriaceae bacterium]